MSLPEFIDKIIISAGTVTPVILFQIKQYFTNKKDNKILQDSLKETYAQGTRMNETLTAHIERADFSTELHGIIQARAANVIRLSQLDSRCKSVMKEMAKKLEDLSFSYYYNKNRKIKHEMQDFLDVEFEDIETGIKRITKQGVQDFKTYKYPTGKTEVISFYDFIYDEKNRNPFKNLRILKIALEENGFDDEEGPDFIETMDKFTKLILVSFIEDVNAWNEIIDTEK
jgi:hypothetical protein